MTLKTKNNVETSLKADLADSWESTIIIKTWEWALFPTTGPFRVTIEQFLTISWITYVKKREVIEITSRTWDILTIWTRAIESCVQDETLNPKVQTSIAQDFNWWDKISIYTTAWKEEEQDTELARLEAEKAELDVYNAFVVAISAIVDLNTANRHSHSNKSTLDLISAAFTTTLKSKLDWIATSANNYSLPIATTSVVWWVKVDWSSISVDWAWTISVSWDIWWVSVDLIPLSNPASWITTISHNLWKIPSIIRVDTLRTNNSAATFTDANYWVVWNWTFVNWDGQACQSTYDWKSYCGYQTNSVFFNSYGWDSRITIQNVTSTTFQINCSWAFNSWDNYHKLIMAVM